MQNDEIQTINQPIDKKKGRKSNIVISTIEHNKVEETGSQEIRDSKQWLASYLNNSMEDDFRRRYFSRIKTDLKKNLDSEETDTSSNDGIEQKKSSPMLNESVGENKVGIKGGDASDELDLGEYQPYLRHFGL